MERPEHPARVAAALPSCATLPARSVPERRHSALTGQIRHGDSTATHPGRGIAEAGLAGTTFSLSGMCRVNGNAAFARGRRADLVGPAGAADTTGVGEVLVSGPPERPRRGWPWLVAAVVVLLAAAALAAPRLLGGSTDEPSRGQSASPSASPSPAPSPRPEEDLARPRLDGVRAA